MHGYPFFFLTYGSVPLLIKATILSLCFFVYFFDTTAAISHLQMSSQKETCCKKSMAKHKEQGQCPRDKKDGTKDCFNCPLDYLATITTAVSIFPSSIPFHKFYSPFTGSFLSGYQSKAWKPPDQL